MSRWTLKSMLATAALLGLVGPAAAMKKAGGQATPKQQQQQQQQQRNGAKAPPPGLGGLQRSTPTPLDDKKAPGEVKPGEAKPGEVPTASASATPLVKALQGDVKTATTESATAKPADESKPGSSEAGKEHQASASKEGQAKNPKAKSGDAPGRPAAKSAPLAPKSVKVKALTLEIARRANLSAAGGKKSFDTMVERLDEGSLHRGEKQGGTDRQLRLDIQNISQNFDRANFINFQIQVNGGKLPNKEHTSLANVILDKRLLATPAVALQKLKEGLAKSFSEGAKVIVTLNDEEGAAFIEKHDPTKKGTELEEE